jgi:hypothetical protein
MPASGRAIRQVTPADPTMCFKCRSRYDARSRDRKSRCGIIPGYAHITLR